MAAKTVLLVDDEEIVIGVGRQMLEKLEFAVLTANNGKEALDVYKNNQTEIDFVVLDMIMPDMGAADTYDGLRSINPAVKVLLSSICLPTPMTISSSSTSNTVFAAICCSSPWSPW